MSLFGTVFKVGVAAVAAAGVTAWISAKTAPEDPDSFRYQVRQYLRDASAAGEEAKAVRQAELISRFQGNVNDYDALRTEINHAVPAADETIARALPSNPAGVDTGSSSKANGPTP